MRNESTGVVLEHLNWLDEADGRLTRVLIGWPAALPIISPIQKHVRYGLNHPKEVDLDQLVKDTKGRMTAAMVNYPELDEHFRPIIERGG